MSTAFMTGQNTTNIYDFVQEEINNYEKPEGIELEDGYTWQMKQHLRRSYLYLNSQFEEQNEERTNRPFKNITLPIMNVQFRTVDFDVKDILIYVDDPNEDDFQSLIISKYHNVWALENFIDTFIDQMIDSYCTYGGVLIKKTNKAKPEVVNLRNLAFCNQTNILAYPFGIRHTYSFAQLRKENKKWGETKNGATTDIETLIGILKKEGKKEVEVYEVHGLMPNEWLKGDYQTDYYDENAKDVYQMQIVAFYQDENKQDKGVTLFRQKYDDINDFFKFLSRDEVEGRALGRGGVEELFEPQQWTNKNEIIITKMLEAASKTWLWSDDPRFKGSNTLINLKNNEILGLSTGSRLNQIDTYPRNIPLFNDAIMRWQELAQRLGSASDPLLGDTPNSGTPFKLYEAQQIESKSPHIWRQGKIATFLDEIYRDWLIPHFASEVSQEKTFTETLSADEMEKVVNRVVERKTENFKKNMILGLQEINEELIENYKNKIKEDIIKKGPTRFFKIFKEEMKDKKLKVRTNITGKQKNLALLTDKIVGIFRQYMELMGRGVDVTPLNSLLNPILEYSGLSPIMFGYNANRPKAINVDNQPAQLIQEKGPVNNSNQIL
jgi:hypothetical protein